MTGYDYLALQPGYEGSCPCSGFVVDDTLFDAHCWRVCTDCTYAGLHYEGDTAVAERVFAALQSMGWGEWQLQVGLRHGMREWIKENVPA